MAAMNFAIMISINHVRTSYYNVRFHALTYLFGVVSGLLAIYLVIRSFGESLRCGSIRLTIGCCRRVYISRRQLSTACTEWIYTRVNRQMALALSQKAPGSVLMGGYWETYVFVGLQPTNTMTPVPFEGVLNRIPWTIAILRDSQHVVIEYRNSGLVPKDLSPPNELRNTAIC